MDNSLQQIDTLHPKMRAIALQAYKEAVAATPVGVHPVITQGYRTFEESDKLYQQGRTTPGEVVTWALPGHSWHNYALALDFVLIVNGHQDWTVNHNWMTVVNIFKSHGFTWGGDFPPVNGKDETDYPHFEMKFGQNTSGLLIKHLNKDFIPGTTYVNI